MVQYLIENSIFHHLTFSGVDAHISIPSDRTPLILAGLRLHMNIAIRSCISSIGICLTKPLTMVLVLPSAKSTSSTYKESASGCFFTKRKTLLFVKESHKCSKDRIPATILPIRKSIRPMSIISSSSDLPAASVGLLPMMRQSN